MRRQFYDLKPGDALTVDGSVVTIEAKSGQRVRVKVESNGPIQKGRPEPSVARPFPQAAPVATAPLPRPTFKDRSTS